MVQITQEKEVREEQGEQSIDAQANEPTRKGEQNTIKNEASDNISEEVGKDKDRKGSQLENNASEHNIAEGQENYRFENNKAGDNSSITFEKQDVKCSRGQSFQSMLSSASLKSLGQQAAQQRGQHGGGRNNLISKMNSFKDFRSYIQAPALSSLSNSKLMENSSEIGKQHPFDDKPVSKEENDSGAPEYSGSYDDDQETLAQQQKLTLNALKKLSLSARPTVRHEEDVDKVRKQHEIKAGENGNANEPYYPAEVDLSAFASLKRQPKIAPKQEKNKQEPKLSAVESQNSIVSNDGSIVGAVASTDSLKSTLITRNSISEHTKNKTGQPSWSHGQVPNERDEISPAIKDSQNNNVKNIAPNYGRSNPTRRPSDPPKSKLIEPVKAPAFYERRNYNNRHESRLVGLKKQNERQQLQQIKGLRSPLYVPAVLRKPDEASSVKSASLIENHTHELNSTFNRENNDTPSPHDDPGSIHSVYSSEHNESSDSLPLSSSSTSGYFNFLNRRCNNYFEKAPTRKHWAKDEDFQKCGIPECPKVFNFFERRHHCRKCGGIFCKEHTSHYLYINNWAQFTTGGRGKLSKVCDNCIREYQLFIKNEFGLDAPSVTSQKSLAATDPSCLSVGYHPSAQDASTSPLRKPIAAATTASSDAKKDDLFVGSIPANWNWSSF